MYESLDVEPKRWTNPHYIFPIQFLQDRRFPSVIEAAIMVAYSGIELLNTVDTYRKSIRISFSFCLFFLMIVNRPIPGLRKPEGLERVDSYAM